MSGSDVLVVTRWRRWGKDRLYVVAPGGGKLGWWDLLTDEAHPEAPEHLPALTTAAASWRAQGSEPPSEPVPQEQGTSPQAPSAGEVPANEPAPVPERPWVDLATNRPGAEARERADAEFLAAPIRSTLARLVGVRTSERSWRLGADGEERVADQLAKVVGKDPRWAVLHAIPVGTRGSDIDHLVIGPGGIFSVNAKHHRGADIWVGGNTFLVNGHKQPYVRNSRYEAERAARLLGEASGLPLTVEGLIVTVNAKDVTIKSQPVGVTVVQRMQVAKWLLRHGEVIPNARLVAIYEAARRSTTWRP